MDRRLLIKAAFGAPPLALGPSIQTEPSKPGELAELGFVGPEDDPRFSGNGAVAVGSLPATGEEIATATRIIQSVGNQTDHMAVAVHVLDLQTDRGDGYLYNETWPDRANPLISHFLNLALTTPNHSDYTPWCAAFVTFCLTSANKPVLKRQSAWARSYMEYGRPRTGEPQRGDILVFERPTRNGSLGGHVCFFWARKFVDGQEVYSVLGGNQGPSRSNPKAKIDKNYAQVSIKQRLIDRPGQRLLAVREVVGK